MKILITRTLLLLLLALPACQHPVQKPAQGQFTPSLATEAEIKRQAEAGNVQARCKLASQLALNLRQADALQWYAKAADQGDVESLYQMGHKLLFGAPGHPEEQSVVPKPSEGIRLVFRAATNGCHAASYDLFVAYGEGRGVERDLLQAYAWLQFHADTAPPSNFPSETAVQLRYLSQYLGPAITQAGKRQAARYRAGEWPELLLQASSEKDRSKRPRNLTLSAITAGPKKLAVINGKPLAEGETATLPTIPRSCFIKVLKIKKDSVVISIEGENYLCQLWLASAARSFIDVGPAQSAPLGLGGHN